MYGAKKKVEGTWRCDSSEAWEGGRTVKERDSRREKKTRLENNKLKENEKSMKTLHRDQLRLNDDWISDQISTIKSLRAKLKWKKKMEENKNHVTLTKIESGSSNSTSSDNENISLSDDGMNMKMRAVVRKKFSLTEQESDTVKIDVPRDSDGSGSVSLL